MQRVWEGYLIIWDIKSSLNQGNDSGFGENWEVFWKSKPTEHNYRLQGHKEEEVSRMTPRFLAMELDRWWGW